MQRKGTNWKLPFGLGLAVLVVVAVVLIPTVAFGGPDAAGHAIAGHDMAGHDMAGDDAALKDELAQVRRVTARFHRVEEALDAGYELGWVNGSGVRILTGCVSHPTAGAMGYHYFNAELMADNAVDALEPEALVYAPAADGGLKLAAVEWVVRGPDSNPPGISEPPSVLGMEMHILVPPPGPAFYLMHAWVWANNPAGMFADWNPEVSCT
jgi:hypothetical protein